MSGFDGNQYEVKGVNPLDGSECYGMPRVTTILNLLDKPALMQWAANVAADTAWDEAILQNFEDHITETEFKDQVRYAYKQVSEDAVDIGSQLHDALESYNRFLMTGKECKAPEDETLDRWFSDWVAFCKKASLKPVVVEKTIIGQGYAGTMDLVAECDYIWFTSKDKTLQSRERERRVTVCFDFKTGKASNYHEPWSMQTAAYRRALEDEGMEIDVNCAIRFNKLNKKMARVCDYSGTYGNDLERFFALRDYWWRTKYKGE